MPSWGVTAAGFTVKPLSAILSDMQAAALASIDPAYDLSPATPDGQMLGIVAAQAASGWELLQIAFNQYNREDVEGAGLDNLGDITGTPREGESYTQVYATLVFGSGAVAGPYAPGAFIANVAGNASLTFANLNTVTLAGGVQTLTVLMRAQTIGPTPTINIGTLTVITTAVTGWASVNNIAVQSQMGLSAELDAAYGPRQEQDLAAQGSCNPSATAAAIVQMGASQQPPITLSVAVVENTRNAESVIQGIDLPGHSYAPVIYDGGTGWAAANPSLIAAVVYAQKPEGILSVGSTSATLTDPVLGLQVVSWTLPTGMPLYVSATVVPRAGVGWAALSTAIQSALVAAAVAPTPANGVPPAGQLVPGSPVIGSQLEAIIMGVPGMFDVQALTFGFSASPLASTPITLPASEVATILGTTAATNIVLVQGTYP